jgi:hypothetical protein
MTGIGLGRLNHLSGEGLRYTVEVIELNPLRPSSISGLADLPLQKQTSE